MLTLLLFIASSFAGAADFKAMLTAESAATEAAVAGPAERLKHELEPRETAIWKQLTGRFGRDPAVSVLERAVKDASADIKKLDPAKMQTREQFDAYDGLIEKRAAATRMLEHAVALQRAAARKNAAMADDGKKLLAELADVETKIDTARKEIEIDNARALAAKTRLKNYTTAAEKPPEKAALLTLRPPGDAAERAKRFAARNSAESLAALSREFFSRIDLATPGMEKAAALFKAGKHAEALDAWRDFFFARLREPQKYGLPANWGGDLDTASLLREPDKQLLDDAMQGLFATPRIKAQVGTPGSINWADVGADPNIDPLKNPYLDFYTTRGQGGFVHVLGPHLVLLDGYAATGEKRYLDRWAEVLDDWAMNAPDDMEHCPLNIRQYPVLCSFTPVALASTLTDALAAQPEFATAMPSPTLARIMLTTMEEYPASFVRLARRGIYNWRCIAMTGAVLTAQAYPEFDAARWQLGEAKRLMELNWTHKILRDGSNLEQGNWGHEPNDQVHLGRAFRLLQAHPPAWLDEAWISEWQDNVKVNARYYLHTLKPDGYTYKFSRVTTADKFVMRGRFDDPAMPIQTNLLLGEDEARRRLEWVYGDDAVEAPRINSEFLPYYGAAILRSGWEPDASFLYFQSSPNKDCNGREDANGFSLFAHGHEMLLAPPLAVDDRTQNIHYGLVPHPGGKTIWLSYDDRGKPVESRFHTSAKFDFTEGKYEGVYQCHGPKAEADEFGEYGYAKIGDKLRAKDNKPIRDVLHARHILSLRGEDVVIVTDRFRSADTRKFSQNYTLFNPVPREGWKRRVELANEEHRPPLVIDTTAKMLRTDNESLPGISVRHFGTIEPTYTVTDNAFGKTDAAESSDEALAALGSSKLKKWTMGLPLPFSQKVRVDWNARGPQVLVTAITTRPGAIGGKAFEGDLRDVEAINAEGVTGFRAVTRQGTKIEYFVANVPRCHLGSGPFDVFGEALLVATRPDGVSGIVLGGVLYGRDGKGIAGGDFEFSIPAGGGVVITKFYCPIEPVEISPEATVFTESQRVELKCATDGVEIRYTLDGSDPTPRSMLYKEPFTLTATTRVKARAFRTGVTEMPWAADGTHATAMSWATFEKQAILPAVAVTEAKPGLHWLYVEGRWAELFRDAWRMPALKSGESKELIDVSMRDTDGAFAVTSVGMLNVPADGVYTFYAPHEWQYPDGESGYDLCLNVQGHEWQPATRRHGQGMWSIALAKGAHPFSVTFTDFRPKKLKGELWDDFPNPEIMWKGVTPTLEVSGPGLEKGPVPAEWLSHAASKLGIIGIGK